MTDRSEFWVAVNGFPGVTARAARRAENEGWDGVSVPDSQNLTGDPYVALSLAAAQTDRILLATGVTNPVTRHPAVTATSIATVQEESEGRAVLGAGRGDSSLAYLGMAPASLETFARYIDAVQDYLRGDAVPFANEATVVTTRSDSLGLKDAPDSSQLRWLRHATQAKVPLEVVASGPKVIALGAVAAERLTLAVGADLSRLRWAIDIAREARAAAGLDPDALRLGVMVPIVAHADRMEARRQMADAVPGFIRFSVMHGSVNGPVSDSVRTALELLHRSYDMNQHARHGRMSELVSDDLLDTFTIAGPPAECVRRLSEIRDLGVDVFHLQGAFFTAEPSADQASWQLIASEVLPSVRRMEPT